MKWKRKSEMDEMYCAVHNVDCPLQGHTGDPMVLHINPGQIPSGWICPQAVNELAQWEREAEHWVEENDLGSPAGLVIPSSDEETVAEALRMNGYDDEADKVRLNGIEALSLEEIDGAIHSIEKNQDDLPREAEDIHGRLTEFWEANA